MKLATIILAAGQGTRMKSELPKVLHPVAGRSMVSYVIDTAVALGDERPTLVVGYRADQVRAAIGDRVEYVDQPEQLGTGHAVMQARGALEGRSDVVLVLYGDTPFVSAETLRAMLDEHAGHDAAITLLTFRPPDPLRYGRIVRSGSGRVVNIVEFKEATPEQLTLREVNSGILCFEAGWLWPHLNQLQPKHGHGEYYLTDLVALAAAEVKTIATREATTEEVGGIDDRVRLAWAERLMRERIAERLMLSGVTIVDPSNSTISAEATIEPDTTIYPGSHVEGATHIGRGCHIGPNTIVRDSVIGERCRIESSVVEGATLEGDVRVGPFAHLRSGAYLERGVECGNFAEVKNSRLGAGTKQHHFSYLGDATLGRKVNVGAGAITCNYDGAKKHHTDIGDGAFIGSDTMLVAPVRVGAGSQTGAGSVVTRDVADGELVYGVPARPKPKPPESSA
ncbi:MAG TPA: bifunctional UDP-N-acetylglucosamine diphosphorylase/glucosamine-1-phosphate N-acetyltransferase GlmU [Anaerolineae bacterium]|nr:bifunctional UDP-N-acetylglucosamine diphosphorylase/glucosamine-1-phosphate N-acetyltransferase GlmU [Anaerolineae bacterium]